MKSVLETIQIATVLGLMFSFALSLGWVALQGFLWAVSGCLKPAASPARDFAARTPRN